MKIAHAVPVGTDDLLAHVDALRGRVIGSTDVEHREIAIAVDKRVDAGGVPVEPGDVIAVVNGHTARPRGTRVIHRGINPMDYGETMIPSAYVAFAGEAITSRQAAQVV